MHIRMREDENCARWEAAIADLHDGALAPEEERRLREHAAGCNSCGTLLSEAERGRAWARLLHDAPPTPPAELLGRILARTPSASADPASQAGRLVLPHPAALHGQREARVLMTVAMAFFSAALTFSVSGLRLHDLEPSHVQAAASRQLFGAKKEVVSFYDNLRVIREIVATMESLRRAAPGPEPNGERLQPSAREGAGAALLAGARIAPFERNQL